MTWSLDTDMRDGVPLLMQPVSDYLGSGYLGFTMDGMIGKDYETGLAHLKTVVESAA